VDYSEAKYLSLKAHPEFNERWVQTRIGGNPSLLGLGDVIVKDEERRQPRAGRLDLLLQDPETTQRYEVELQLGATDESHIIRTIEYWDYERRRYPQYDHCAVIIAEDITSRFLNVIALFNGLIPLIAIQLRALQVGDRVTLVATRVMDRLDLGLDEEEETAEPADRSYWESRGSVETMKLADEMLEVVREVDPGLDLKYNRGYFGLARNGVPNNFMIMRPRRNHLGLSLRITRSEELSQRIESVGLDVLDYDMRRNRYRMRLEGHDVRTHRDFLGELVRLAFENASL